jgi:carbamoyl-phosphate synthase large subunit
MKVPYYTTAAASAAAARAILSVRASELEVRSMQDYYAATGHTSPDIVEPA